MDLPDGFEMYRGYSRHLTVGKHARETYPEDTLSTRRLKHPDSGFRCRSEGYPLGAEAFMTKHGKHYGG